MFCLISSMKIPVISRVSEWGTRVDEFRADKCRCGRDNGSVFIHGCLPMSRNAYVSETSVHFPAYVFFVAVVLVLVCLSVAILYRNVHTGMEVSYFVNETPLGDKTRLLLADGSSVWLNSGSTLKYSTGFNAKNRVVVLDGEGYFEVKQNGGVPFTVHTHGYDVVVKGTKFNVSAYEEDPFISTTLIEGKVTVNYKDESVDMQPGEEMKLIKSTGELQHSRVMPLSRMPGRTISW